MILLSKLPISVATLLTFASPLSAFEGDSSSSGHNRHRRLVAPNANIKAELNAEKAKNPNSKAHLKLQASVAGSDDVQEYDVVEATPAVTDKTTISSSPGGPETYVNIDDLAQILVSDSDDKIILLAVEPDGSTQGVIADKSGGGTSKHFSQAKGNGKKVSSVILDGACDGACDALIILYAHMILCTCVHVYYIIICASLNIFWFFLPIHPTDIYNII